jgi:hypothetical protein
MNLITTRAFWTQLGFGLFCFLIGFSGVIVRFVRPDLLPPNYLVYLIGSLGICGIAGYRLARYSHDPGYLRKDQKRFSDERLVAVREKAAVFSFFFLCTLFGMWVMCNGFVCQVILGIADPEIILRIGRLLSSILIAVVLVLFASIGYYYYFGRM